MKKILLFLLLAVVLVACGKKDDASSNNQAEEGVQQGSLNYGARNATDQEKVFLEQEVLVYVDKYHTDSDVLIEEGVNKITSFKVFMKEVTYDNPYDMPQEIANGLNSQETISVSPTGEYISINANIEYNGNEPTKIVGTIEDKKSGEIKNLEISEATKVKDIIQRIIYKEYLPLQDEVIKDVNISYVFEKKTYTTQASAEGNKQDVVYFVNYRYKPTSSSSNTITAFNRFIITDQNTGDKILFYSLDYKNAGTYSDPKYQIDRLYAVYKKDNKFYKKVLNSKNYGDDDTANFNTIVSSRRYINIDDIIAAQ